MSKELVYRKTIFKPIPGLKPYYVSRLGEVLSCKHGKKKLLSINPDKLGYARVKIQMNNKGVSAKVHRLVAKTFLKNPINKKEINHIDGDKLNNAVSNLEYCTRSENMKHAINLGLARRHNEFNGNAKLNSFIAWEIKFQRSIGVSTKELSLFFKVSQSTIQRIVSGKNWKNINIEKLPL